MRNLNITVFSNSSELSVRTKIQLDSILEKKGFSVSPDFSDDTDLIICIGGDGAFLEAIRKYGFPECPAVGINTGHLGFFQEIRPSQISDFLEDYEKGNYSIQTLNTVKCSVTTEDDITKYHYGLNEIVIKGRQSYAIHLNISIGNTMIEKFSGDGILVSTSAGSTAYNYSLGGSIVDPRLNLLQVTPIAPMNTTAFRSFTSSILLPSDLSIGITPVNPDEPIFIANDGIETCYSKVSSLDITVSDKIIQLIRFKDYSFWNKVKDKFL